MTKNEVQSRVYQGGRMIELEKFSWDEEAAFFSSSENNLLVDFGGENNITMKTGENCVFKTGYNCSFDTGCQCNFKTGANCVFKTGYGCGFITGGECVVIRKDVFEVVELEEGREIRLGEYKKSGFTLFGIECIIEGNKMFLSREKVEELKNGYYE